MTKQSITHKCRHAHNYSPSSGLSLCFEDIFIVELLTLSCPSCIYVPSVTNRYEIKCCGMTCNALTRDRVEEYRGKASQLDNRGQAYK